MAGKPHFSTVLRLPTTGADGALRARAQRTFAPSSDALAKAHPDMKRWDQRLVPWFLIEVTNRERRGPAGKDEE